MHSLEQTVRSYGSVTNINQGDVLSFWRSLGARFLELYLLGNQWTPQLTGVSVNQISISTFIKIVKGKEM